MIIVYIERSIEKNNNNYNKKVYYKGEKIMIIKMAVDNNKSNKDKFL